MIAQKLVEWRTVPTHTCPRDGKMQGLGAKFEKNTARTATPTGGNSENRKNTKGSFFFRSGPCHTSTRPTKTKQSKAKRFSTRECSQQNEQHASPIQFKIQANVDVFLLKTSSLAHVQAMVRRVESPSPAPIPTTVVPTVIHTVPIVVPTRKSVPVVMIPSKPRPVVSTVPVLPIPAVSPHRSR
jgi:hypothetical protein